MEYICYYKYKFMYILEYDSDICCLHSGNDYTTPHVILIILCYIHAVFVTIHTLLWHVLYILVLRLVLVIIGLQEKQISIEENKITLKLLQLVKITFYSAYHWLEEYTYVYNLYNIYNKSDLYQLVVSLL